MKCPKCGTEIKEYEDDRFCRRCGYPIEKDVAMKSFE